MFRHTLRFFFPAVFYQAGSKLIKPADDFTPQSLSPADGFKLFKKADADANGKKRLIICADGTWKNASGTILPPTNVTRLARSVDRHGYEIWGGPEPSPPVPQIAYYVAGVGSHSVLPVPVDYIYSGVTGEGIDKTILNAYCFLCNNYNFAAGQDDIILVGFSRGAFAVRCLAAFVDEIGLIRRKYLPFLPEIFENWLQRKGKIDPKYRKIEDIACPVRIKVLAEWDPVSSVWDSRFKFVGGTIPDAVDNAFMAIAINERRWSFQPMLWTGRGKPVEGWVHKLYPPSNRQVEQCLFAGHHSDIGGGNKDAGLSTIALLWMISRIKEVNHIAFDDSALLQSVLPLPPDILLAERTFEDTPPPLETAPQPDPKYESLSRSMGNVNHPPWWWALTHMITLGLISGDRSQWLSDTARSGLEFNEGLKVHFTVPLLLDEAAADMHANQGKVLSQEVKLWNGKFQSTVPNEEELKLWKKWDTEAKHWHPKHWSEEKDEMQEWGRVLNAFGMKPSEERGDDPVVHRVLRDMKAKWPKLYEEFEKL